MGGETEGRWLGGSERQRRALLLLSPFAHSGVEGHLLAGGGLLDGFEGGHGPAVSNLPLDALRIVVGGRPEA